MVVFTCGHCGESVQKPKVEKHYSTKCRNKNPNLSCMDCFKDFLGNDYEAHTKCITEEERYSGKGFQAKEKKGEKKQNAWVEMLQAVLDEQKNASKNVLRIIETISKHNNTPRKKPKFINFVKNVCGTKTNPKDIDAAWDLISVKLSELSKLNSQNNIKKGNKPEANDSKDGENATETERNIKNGNIKQEENGTDENKTEENGTQEHGAEENGTEENGPEENGTDENGVKNNTDVVNGHAKESVKLSKKQRKEEKKRQKYEAELLSAEAPVSEVLQEEGESKKKGKKNKNKDKTGDEENIPVEGKNKNKKRKRQDTVNNPEVVDNAVVTKESKKKLKTDEEAEESICLHDQNVAKSEELDVKKSGKFDWHEVIVSVLQKKDNEMQFKRLQKKVLGEYSEYTGEDVDDRIADKFIKKLKSAPNVRVDKNKVMLIED